MGTTYKVSLDGYEAKFHSRFSSITNDNRHKHLPNYAESNNYFTIICENFLSS